jgi:hypothetical protein
MRTGALTPALTVALLLAPALTPAAGPGDDRIPVELKDFKFKVPEALADRFSYDEGAGRLCFYTNGRAEAAVKVPADGDYEVVVRASCDSALNERAKFKVALDGQPAGQETLLTDDGERDYALPARLKAGEHTLAIEFTNDAYKEGEYDRNLYTSRGQ